MKNIIFMTLTLLSTCIFGEQPFDLVSSNLDLAPLPVVFKETPVSKQSFFYLRFTAAESDLVHGQMVLPGVGVGYRRVSLSGDSAADISVSGIGREKYKQGRIFWTAPKASYMHYFRPDAKQTPYVGGGLAWGGLKSKNERFIGMIPSATIGYEFVHKGSFLGFSELNISQPALAVYQEGSFPGPSIELSTGIGF